MARPAAKKTKPAPKIENTLASAISGAPRLTDRKAAQARLAEWLTEIGRSADGTCVRRLPQRLPPKRRPSRRETARIANVMSFTPTPVISFRLTHKPVPLQVKNRHAININCERVHVIAPGVSS